MRYNFRMDFREKYGFMSNNLDDAEDIHQIQATTVRSLERIQSIYDEIMVPRDISSPIFNFEFEEVRTPPDSPETEQRRNVRSDGGTFDELCTNCRNVISHCNYCKFCVSGEFSDEFRSNSTDFRFQNRHRRNNSEPIKVTVPRPFVLSHMDVSRQMAAEEKMCKLKEEQKNKLEKEKGVKIHSRPVPKNTYLPLYQQMVEDSKKRTAQRREKVVEMRSINPIPCVVSSDSVPNKEKRNTFRAKPVPKHILSNKISEKLKNQEEIRKMMIAQRAEELLKSASSPFSRKPPTSRSVLDLNDVAPMSSRRRNDGRNVVPTKINISAITDRLYVKKCRETMDDWNKKVLDFEGRGSNKDLNFPAKSKSSLPFSAFPFSFFPVRMSNAAISRDKQIREEILARKRREDSRSDPEEDLIRRKKEALRTILPRLKSLLPEFHSQRDIEDKVKSFRATQSHRKREYEKELEEIMMRVSKQLLLIERQSKVTKEDGEQGLLERGGSSEDREGDSQNEEEDTGSEASENS